MSRPLRVAHLTTTDLTLRYLLLGQLRRLRGGRLRGRGRCAQARHPRLRQCGAHYDSEVIRDVFTEDFAQLTVSGDQAWAEVSGYVEDVAPDLARKIAGHAVHLPRPDVVGPGEECPPSPARK